jgi:hypothetical protein
MAVKTARVMAPAARIPAAGFGAVVALWAVFGAVLLIDPSRLDMLWAAFRDWPLLGQAVGWVLLLPWLVATLIWGAGWALWVRLLLIGLIALFTLVGFSPRQPKQQAATDVETHAER